MRFFDVDVAVCRDDVLAVLNILDGTIAPLQTLCDSPRASEQNDKALEMALDTRCYIADMLDASELTNEDNDRVEAAVSPTSPTSRL